ncbi:hypothetical protein CRM22_006847 [Opisthorchis felineus]|uniref:Phosphatidylinositol N-acetylglucosaminyltransferase subunit C n=1 Tax=Opisthorchis felineus TaxID=147828 RepID=A0A4S2LIT1_OPIFE|nr:hypothetical protein CRM22_006847 [Opisthorchis felineus]
MKQRWEKVLYKDQGVPDNFVSPHFLSELRKNLYIRKYNLVSVMIDAGSIYQQLCCVSVFISFYFYLLFNWVSPVHASIVLMFFVIIGYLLFWFFGTSEQVNLQRALFHIRTGLIIFTFSLILAPILHSLLATVSTDSIYAMAGLFFLVNWACTDYTTQLADYAYEPGSNTTAFSSSLLAALCLASRLPTPYHTFVLIAAGTVLFALWPSLVQVIRSLRRPASVLDFTEFLDDHKYFTSPGSLDGVSLSCKSYLLG